MSAANASNGLEIGSAANSYQVLARLATGGMAEIFLARSAGVAAVQRHVVLKRVLRERATDIQFVRMFLDEARLAAQLQHPNVAQVYDVGKLGDSYFFTMEYVHGETVRALLLRAHELRRTPPIGCVLAIAAGAAAGLSHAHTRIGVEGRPLGIVHRDVSPSNLMVGYDGSVKVVDFGVAKAADRIAETHSGAVKGKISYLSPEQARGQRLDQRSDLFSLGIVMWEMLTVERLYKHDSDFDTMKAIIHAETPPPSSRRRDVPPELDAVVLRCLAKSPERRFQTAEELGEAIERVAVQTSSPLSAAGLSRFLRELFGAKPEPWRTLAVAEERAEIVTVTSEPIPKELQIPINDPVDRRLAAVVDLSVSMPVDFGGPAPVGAAAAAAVTATEASVLIAPAPSTGSPAGGLRRRRGLRLGALLLGLLGLGTAVGIAVAVALDEREIAAPARHDEQAAPPVQAPVLAEPPPEPAAAAAIDAAIEAEPAAATEPEPATAAGAAATEPEPAPRSRPAVKTKPRPARTSAGRKPARPDGERRDPKPDPKPDCADPMDCPR